MQCLTVYRDSNHARIYTTETNISDVENCQETATYSTNLTYTEIRRILLSQLHERSIELSLRAAYTYRPVLLLVKNHQRKIDLLIIKKDKCF